jgi:5'-nucleotidase
MRVLVSNDDGVDAPGILVLAEHLAAIGEVVVVAPDRDRSGASNSLTLDQPIRAKRLDDGRYRVSGTPTDCVYLALSGLLDVVPDIVVSGINSAANLGDDVIYSGTVSAAMEGRFLGLPAIAVSLVTRDHKGVHYDSAAMAVMLLMRKLLVDPLPADTILNVNVPDLPWHEIRGLSVARLGRRHRASGCIEQIDRLFRDKLQAPVALDDASRVRVDDWELSDTVQAEMKRRWAMLSTENLGELADLGKYRVEFLKLFGFGLGGVDYSEDLDPRHIG